jgi:hypothetical protein
VMGGGGGGGGGGGVGVKREDCSIRVSEVKKWMI